MKVYRFLFWMLLTLGLAACSRQDPDPSTAKPNSSSSAKPNAATAPSSGAKATPDAPVVELDQTAFGPNAEADAAWQALTAELQPPTPPEEWQSKEPSKEEMDSFKAKVATQMVALAAKCREFQTKYPKSEHATDARDQEFEMLKLAVQLGQTNQNTRLVEMENSRMKDPNLSEEQKLSLRVESMQRRAQTEGGEDPAKMLAAMEKGIVALREEFPNRPELASLWISVADGWLNAGNPEKSRAALSKVDTNQIPSELREMAAEISKKMERLGRPLKMQFKAIDGRDVSITALKGKVVLIDFWATWCGPCRAELPNVKAAYTQLKDQGFEILGISLDDNEDTLRQFVTKEKMTWPQHFGGRENPFAQEFGIEAIPTMWLVDKQGNLRDTNAREDLLGKAKKLLAEK